MTHVKNVNEAADVVTDDIDRIFPKKSIKLIFRRQTMDLKSVKSVNKKKEEIQARN